MTSEALKAHLEVGGGVPSPIACDMMAIPQDQRQVHINTSKELFSRIQEFRELENGYEFRFTSDVIGELARFIALEKLCCPFLNFVVEVEEDGGPLWLRLTGRAGVKAFIREEISGLLGHAIVWDNKPTS